MRPTRAAVNTQNTAITDRIAIVFGAHGMRI
jgi:hypothetical protein